MVKKFNFKRYLIIVALFFVLCLIWSLFYYDLFSILIVILFYLLISFNFIILFPLVNNLLQSVKVSKRINYNKNKRDRSRNNRKKIKRNNFRTESSCLRFRLINRSRKRRKFKKTRLNSSGKPQKIFFKLTIIFLFKLFILALFLILILNLNNRDSNIAVMLIISYLVQLMAFILSL